LKKKKKDIKDLEPKLSDGIVRQDEKNPCGISVNVNQVNLTMMRKKDKIYIFERRCPHRRQDLSLGDIEDLGIAGPVIKCPYHFWQFSLETGQCHWSSEHRDDMLLKTFPYQIKDGLIWVGFDKFDPSYFDAEDF